MDDSLTRALMTPAVLRAVEDMRRMHSVYGGVSNAEIARAGEAYLQHTRGSSLATKAMAVQAQAHLRQIVGLTASLDRIVEAQKQIAQLQPSALGGLLNGIQYAGIEWDRWRELTHSLVGTRWIGLADMSSKTWGTSVASLTENLRLAGLSYRNPNLTERLLAPYDAYSKFARAALSSVERVTSERRWGLSAALTFAGAEISAAETIVTETLDEDWSEEFQLLPRPPRPNAFRQLRSDLLMIQVPADVTPADLVSFSPTADLMDGGRRFAGMILECNTNAALAGRASIFTYTATMVEALQTLPFTVATDKDGLARVVDALYFVLYEGAGTDKLRYLANGLLTEAECEVVWHVKHFRNKWLRHDPERGDDRNVRKSRQALKEAFEALGIQGLPRLRDDYVQLHRALILKAVLLLESLSSRLAMPIT